MLRLIMLCIVVAAFACERPAAPKQEPASTGAKTERPAAAATFDSPRAVYKRYAETLNASRWADAIALFTQTGKAGLVLANFKGLVLLGGTQHPKQLEYKAVLHELCQAHKLGCKDERWTAALTSKLMAEGDATAQLSDVAELAKAKPEELYVEVMKLLQGVDPNSIVPLDPTLSEVVYTGNTATGIARRADGQTSMMSFESVAERGWMIAQ